jgi:hypothetical protein
MREVGRRILNRLQETHKRNQRLRLVRIRNKASKAGKEHHDAVMGFKAGVGEIETQLETGRKATTKRVTYKKARKKRFGNNK